MGMIWWIFIVIYLSTFAAAATLWFLLIFLVPILTLSAVQYGIQQIPDNEKIQILRNAILFQSPLMIWWAANYTFIYKWDLDLVPGMLFIEIFYAVIMIWFFATISLKSIQLKNYSMILNPIVLIPSVIIIGTIFLIILVLTILFKLPYLGLKLWITKLIINYRNAPEDHLNQYQNLDPVENQDINQTECVICTYPIFQNETTPAVLPCGHIFHFECIDDWIGNRGNTVCPADRRETLRSQIVKLII